jgi:hypothetical protein
MEYWDQYAAGASATAPAYTSEPINNEDYIRLHTAIWGKWPK